MKILGMLLAIMILSFGCFAIHADEGPHGGEIFANSNHTYHAEFVHERDRNKVTVYVLDGKAKDEVAVAAKHVTVKIKGKDKIFQLTSVGGKDGKASRFELKHELFGNQIKTSELHLSMVLVQGMPEESFHLEKD